MPSPSITDLTVLFNALNQPLVIAALAIIGGLILPRIPKVKKSIQGLFSDKTHNDAELKEILMKMTTTMEKGFGNDMTHIKLEIENIGNKIDNLNIKFTEHDDQAKAILSRTNDIWQKVNDL